MIGNHHHTKLVREKGITVKWCSNWQTHHQPLLMVQLILNYIYLYIITDHSNFLTIETDSLKSQLNYCKVLTNYCGGTTNLWWSIYEAAVHCISLYRLYKLYQYIRNEKRIKWIEYRVPFTHTTHTHMHTLQMNENGFNWKWRIVVSPRNETQ